MALTCGLIGVTERSVSPPAGVPLAAPSDVVMINQGGPLDDVNSNTTVANPDFLAIQWSPVSGATGYNIYRSVNGSAFTLYASNVQPKTFVASISSTTMTVTTDNTGGNIIPNVRFYSAITPGVLDETMINGRYGTSSTTGTGGTGTYPVNRSQTATSRTFTAYYFIDSSATNATISDTSRPGNIYDYNVSTLSPFGEGPQSTNLAMYIYRNGFSNTRNSELSFGAPFPNTIYNSTNFSPVGGPFCMEYQVNGGFQPTMDNALTPQWTGEIGAFKYLAFDFNPGAGYSGWGLPNTGVVSHVPTGDVFGKIPAVDSLLTYAQGPVTSNTWVTCKVPLAIVGMNRNSFTGSISGSTVSVTGVGTGLFGSAGIFDNSGYITGTGIPVPCWIQADLSLGGSGPGGTGPGSTWQAYGGPYNPDGPPTGNGAPISVTASSDGTWKFWKTQLYKWDICNLGGPAVQVGMNNMRFTRT